MLLLVDEVTMTSEVGLDSSSLVGSSGVLRSAAGSTIGGGHEGGGIRVGVGRQGKPAVGAKGWGGGGGLGGNSPKGEEAAAAAANKPGYGSCPEAAAACNT